LNNLSWQINFGNLAEGVKMNKKILAVCALSSAFLLPGIVSPYKIQVAKANTSAYPVDALVDLTPKHWAYQAVKYVVENLGIMEPKTPSRFVGDQKATRYELAKTFYQAVQNLEKISKREVALNQGGTPITITDVNAANKDIVDKVVNVYGLMQLMPDSKFMGNREMTRYEIAFDLNNYLMLLEEKFNTGSNPERNRLSTLKDVDSNHWAYPAVKNMVDKYQIMDGYPHKVFGGDQRLTRYEVAALLRRFFDFVDKNIVRKEPEQTPTPTATPVPSATPVPVPVKTPDVSAVKGERSAGGRWDIRFGGAMNSLFSAPTTNTNSLKAEPGLNLDATLWFSELGVNLGSEYLFADFHGANNVDPRFGLNASAQWQLLGRSEKDPLSLRVGLGMTYNQWFFDKGSIGIGPRAEFGVEFPVHPYLSLFLQDAFTVYLQPGWRNDLFAGVNIPAASMLSLQLGYGETRYSLNGVTPFANNQNGLRANLRLKLD